MQEKTVHSCRLKKIDCFFARIYGLIAITEGVFFISWIPAYAGMTKDYWIAWSPGTEPGNDGNEKERCLLSVGMTNGGNCEIATKVNYDNGCIKN